MAVKSIDLNKCIGCGTCIESCPMDVFRLDTVVAEKKEWSPCSLTCPLGVEKRECHYLIRQHMLEEAADTLRLMHPMPSITGRICPHPCENECSRKMVDQAVNINGLEQFLGDMLLEIVPCTSIEKQHDKIGVIGSGPAGLSTAYFLALKGYDITVFEKDSEAGGLLRTAIPSFRLSEKILDMQIDIYKHMGIKFKTNVRFGKDVTAEELAKDGYRALIAATGASKPLGLNVPGVDTEGIITAMAFLQDVKSGNTGNTGSKVVVVGGGSVALDAARSAVRTGADQVHVVCLERLEPGSKDSMPAPLEEIEDAMSEGVRIHPSKAVNEFDTTDGRVSGIQCVECLSVREENGSFNPVYGDSVPFEIEVDTVILAIGQVADPALVPEEFPTKENGLINTEKISSNGNMSIFAAGDAVSGPSTVVEALAYGKKTADDIHRFLTGKEADTTPDQPFLVAKEPNRDRYIYSSPRMERSKFDSRERSKNFNETIIPLTPEQVQMESERCLTCGSKSRIAYLDECQVCRLCQHYCPADAIDISEGQALGSLHAFNVVNLG